MSVLQPRCHEPFAKIRTRSWACGQLSIVREKGIGTLDSYLRGNTSFLGRLRSHEI
jgi:hypothetical protein